MIKSEKVVVVLALFLAFAVGITLGSLITINMLAHQLVEVGHAFGNSNIQVNVDINETAMVDRAYELANPGKDLNSIQKMQVEMEK